MRYQNLTIKQSTMKKLMFIAVFLFSSIGLMAQEADFGIKGGFNYGATGDLKMENASNDLGNIIEGKEKSGYHIGLFSRFEIVGIFLQPELMYTRLNTEYETFNYKIDKIDAPILLGVNVFGPLNIKAGPSFQYILNNELEDTQLKIGDVEKDITVGYQLGAGLNLGRLGFDVRYEGAFTDNTAFSEEASDNFSIDSRPSQWILSLSYAF
ncbi:Outer membrane protein beta-barrel domain-containing protein [Salegentibacter salinarum]|nr:Outer membrane protein beta-barrel domain-containing protein [Salegentibacter salinarum]